MKKLLTTLAIIFSLAASAQSRVAVKDTVPKPEHKTYTVVFNEQSINVLFQVIEQSTFSHIDVEALKKYMIDQLRKQAAIKE